jgi:hypothetical protein
MVKASEIEGYVAEQVRADEHVSMRVEASEGKIVLRIFSVAGSDIDEMVIGCTPRRAVMLASDILRIADAMMGGR